VEKTMNNRHKILVVEDDSDFRGFLEKLLSLKGYAVLSAGNGYEAFNYLNEDTFDLALLDVGLPDLDGYLVLERIKAKLPDTPIIMITGYASVDSAVYAIKKGAYDYLEKPFATEKLLKTIQNALDRKRLETQRKAALKKLVESEEKYHQLFESITDALMIFDAETLKFEDANKATLDLFGYSLEEYCKLKVEDISAEKDQTRKTIEKIRAGQQGSGFVQVRYLQRKDGTIFPGEISAATFTADGRQKIIGSVRNISESLKKKKELLSTKMRLQHLLTTSPAVIYAADPQNDFTTIFISDNVKNKLGYVPEDFLKDPHFTTRHVHPEDLQHVRDSLADISQKKRVILEYRFRHANGQYRWMRDEIIVLHDQQGSMVEAVGSWIDITDRVQAEEKLRESEERYRQLFESESDAVFVFDLESLQIEGVNRAALKLFGYSKAEVLNSSIIDMSAEREKTFESIQSAKETKTAINRIPLRYFQRKDGSIFPGDVSTGTFKSNGRQKAIGSIRDITSQHKAEKKLKESQERFRNLVENSLIGIAIIQDNKFVYQNQVQNSLYGPLPDKSIFRAFKFIHQDDQDNIKKAYESVLTGKAQTAEADFRFYPSGKIDSRSDMRWVQCRATPFNYNGRDAILVNSIDITEAKQLEHQLIIKNKMLSLGRIAAGIAHEIRNPLTGINSYLYTLAELCRSETFESEDIEMMQQIVDQIQVASNKIESVIKRVMDFSKPGAPKMVPSDINESLEEAMKLSEFTLLKNNIKLEKALDKNLPQCYIDPHLVEQVMLNLITNAAGAMENGNGNKMIEVKTYSKNNSVCIGVSDSGPGVPPKLRDKIFDPFFTTKDDGQGIGLNIAQRIIADHNGSLSLNTSKWGGAEFRIELPVEKRMDPR
jgi:PAS domain S-box-containing protein